MGYHVIDPADIEPMVGRPSETRDVADAAGLENLGMRTYAVEPGEDVPYSGLHYHDTQEEVFSVLAGQLSVETPGRTYQVAAGELFVAEPGSPHRAYNDPDRETAARVLAVGAPAVADGHVVDD